jgi:magnesium transporter
MLSFYRSGDFSTVSEVAAASLSSDIIWLDLLNPTAEEIAFVARATGLEMPSFADLSEIEASSRLRTEGGAIFLSLPLAYRGGERRRANVTPLGFVITRERLVTIRFQPLPSFTTFIKESTEGDDPCTTSMAVFVGLIEAIVYRVADVLEGIAADLDTLSQKLFHIGPLQRHQHRPARAEANLRNALQSVGANGDHASQIRDSLLGIARIVPFVAVHAADWMQPEISARLETLRHDVASLSDYDMHLVTKVQLLLDATLGLINIEQNNIIKVLTIVSVVGVPPTLVASMYGMNFKYMPELDWSFGYPYALVLIGLSAVLPLLWFKWRGWF